MSQLFFRVDLISEENKRIKSLKYFDLLDDVNLTVLNYVKFINNNLDILKIMATEQFKINKHISVGIGCMLYKNYIFLTL